MVGGVQIALDNGNFEVLPLDASKFTDEPCAVEPVEPTEPAEPTQPAEPTKPADPGTSEPTKPSTDKEEGGLAYTGTNVALLAGLIALFGAAGAAGVVVSRKHA